MTVEELLARHAIDPSALEPAPAAPTTAETLARYDLLHLRPCSACRRPGDCRTSRAVDTPAGPRWVDLCREDSLAVMQPWRGPSTVEGVLTDLREVAAEMAVPLRTYTDEDGWRDEP